VAHCPNCDGTYDGIELCGPCQAQYYQQIGWWNPGSKRFCYLDEKAARPGRYSDYVVPVYADHHTVSDTGG
jgi:hypothetical protein